MQSSRTNSCHKELSERAAGHWDNITGDDIDDLADVLPALRNTSTQQLSDTPQTAEIAYFQTREQSMLRVIDVLLRKYKQANAAHDRAIHALRNKQLAETLIEGHISLSAWADYEQTEQEIAARKAKLGPSEEKDKTSRSHAATMDTITKLASDAAVE